MSTVNGLCPGRFKNGRPCVVRPRFGKVCSYHRKLGRHSRAVASARDEVVRAARQVNAMLDMIRDDEMVGPVSGNPYGVSPSAGKLLRLKHDELRAAVAALAKLEGK